MLPDAFWLFFFFFSLGLTGASIGFLSGPGNNVGFAATVASTSTEPDGVLGSCGVILMPFLTFLIWLGTDLLMFGFFTHEVHTYEGLVDAPALGCEYPGIWLGFRFFIALWSGKVLGSLYIEQYPLTAFCDLE